MFHDERLRARWCCAVALLMTGITGLSASASRIAATSLPSTPPCRDPFLWPFSNDSIWNTPIGSDAVYHWAGIFRDHSDSPGLYGPPTNFHVDQDWAIRASLGDPHADWSDSYSAFPAPNCTGPFGHDDCCVAHGLPNVSSLPMPFNATTNCVANNNAAALLLPDGRTLVQFQPFYRGVAGGPFMAWYHQGCPQAFPWELDVLGGGAHGAHGGSGLSALGGSLRSTELFEESPPISHALKLELWSHAYYYGQLPFLQNATSYNGGRVQYRWPATGSDSGSETPCASGGLYCGTDALLAPGSLLAIAPENATALAPHMSTVIGKRVLEALTNYGAYVVDDTGSQSNGAALCAEPAVQDEVLQRYNFSLFISNPVTKTQAAPLYDDLLLLYRHLSVVANNGPESIGGGGTPRRPPPPPFCE